MAVTWKKLAYYDEVSSWGPVSNVTISGGVIAAIDNVYNYSVITEGLAAADDLDKITGVPENCRIILRANDPDDVVTLVSGTFLKLRGDFVLNGTYDNIVLVGAGSDVCYEESRCSPNLGDGAPGYDVEDDMKFGAAHELTIASGVAVSDDSGASRNLLIDTEGDAASDDLDNITGYAEGDAVIISPAHDARTVVVKDSSNLNLQGADFTMDNIYDSMFLLNLGSDKWKELSRSGN